MDKYISVEQALKRGASMVKWPSVILFLGVLVMLAILLSIKGVHSGWAILVGFLSGFILAALYSCIMVTKWRIWAFSNVSDVYELKKAAISEQIISKAEWTEKLEIRTKADKEMLALINERFKVPPVFVDDSNVENETAIFDSNLNFRVWGIGATGLDIGCMFMFLPIGILILACGLAAILWDSRLISRKPDLPVIVLNAEGISTKSSGFQLWKDVTNDEVRLEGTGKSSHYVFAFNYPGGSEDFDLNYLKITPRRLNHLLAIYRHRSNKQTTKFSSYF